MHLKSRLLILFMVVALSALGSSTSGARGGNHGPSAGPNHQRHGDVKVAPNRTPGDSEVGDRRMEAPENRRELRERRHRRCRSKARRGIPGGCYLSGDEWVEDIETSGEYSPPAAKQDTAIVPVTRNHAAPANLNVIAPSSDAAMKNELIAARKNWLAKKQISEDAATARARAEYRATQGGSAVDPELIERQRETEAETAEAHRAIGPVVERARATGFSSETLELYERVTSEY